MAKVTIGHQIVDESSIKDERDKDNFYPTPIPFIEWVFNTIRENRSINTKLSYSLFSSLSCDILDVGVGTGNWGTVFSSNNRHMYGVEKNFNRFYGSPAWEDSYEEVIGVDILDHYEQYDVVLGNPPYMRETKKVPGTTSIVRHVLQHNLTHTGVAMFLLPSNFRHGVERQRTLIGSHGPVAIIDIVNRINFKDPTGKNGSYPGEYALFFFQNTWSDKPTYTGYRMEWT